WFIQEDLRLKPIISSHCFFFSSRRRHTRFSRDWSSDVCSSDLRFGKLTKSTQGGAETAVRPVQARPRMASTGHSRVAETTWTGRSEERRVGKEYRTRCRPKN